MRIEKFISVRPYLYHLTAAANLASIEAACRLDSASSILESDGNVDALRIRRAESVASVAGIILRDQKPLHARNCHLERGWEFADLVECLNRHVFFWPGTSAASIEAGANHFRRYASENAVVLKLRTADVFERNSNAPLFSRVNSGAPRWSGGKASTRGPSTFLSSAEFEGTPSEVVEVVFRESVALPDDYEVLEPEAWRSLTRR